jgi:IS5 family transposase
MPEKTWNGDHTLRANTALHATSQIRESPKRSRRQDSPGRKAKIRLPAKKNRQMRRKHGSNESRASRTDIVAIVAFATFDCAQRRSTRSLADYFFA